MAKHQSINQSIICYYSDSPLEDIYTTMYRNPYLKKYYAKCVAKLQVNFVKPLPSRVKDLIRLLKYWNYTENEVSIR